MIDRVYLDEKSPNAEDDTLCVLVAGGWAKTSEAKCRRGDT
jgi:hypothetical protein